MTRLPKLEVKSSASGYNTDVIIAFTGSKNLETAKNPYSALLGKLKKEKRFEAKRSSLSFNRGAGKSGRQNVLFAGLGKQSSANQAHARQLGGLITRKLHSEKVSSFALYVDHVEDADVLSALVSGLLLAMYRFDKYKTKESLPKNFIEVSKIVLITNNAKTKALWTRVIKETTEECKAIDVTRDWGDEPSNYGTPTYYASQAVKWAKQYGLKSKVLNKKEIEKEKMGLLMSVAKGSDRPPTVVRVEYAPTKKEKGAKTIALVGKGVTFDSGGISIKPSAFMEDMRHDMCGAATLFGVVLLCSKLKVKHKVICYMGFSENMPNGNASQPGNVVTSRSGKTVEIINTDAEGRLVLADVLDYAQDQKPDLIIDAATLTGAVGIALGKRMCALMTNDEALADSIQAISRKTGERVWQLPADDDYFEDMKSYIADMKNSVNDRFGGTIRAGMFLKQFIKKGVKWAHFDIAYTSVDQNHLSYCPSKGASGLHVKTIARWIEQYE